MAYLDLANNEAWGLQGRSASREIHLGDAERRVILGAHRDLEAGRTGRTLSDTRLETLRRYAMLERRTGDIGRALLATEYSMAERRIVDAMLAALPNRARPPAPTTARLVCAAAILIPLVAALSAFGWASVYLQDPLIAIVLSGLALLFVMPFASAATAPANRRTGY